MQHNTTITIQANTPETTIQALEKIIQMMIDPLRDKLNGFLEGGSV